MGYGDTEKSNDNEYSSTSGNASGLQSGQGGNSGQQNNQPPANDGLPPAYTPPAYTPPVDNTPPGPPGPPGGGKSTVTSVAASEDIEEVITPNIITDYDFPFDPEPPPTPKLPNELVGFTYGVAIYKEFWDGFVISVPSMTDMEAFNWAISHEIPYQYMPITLTALEPSISGVELEPITLFIQFYQTQLFDDETLRMFKFVDINGENFISTDMAGADEDWVNIHFGFELPIYNWMANPVTEIGLNALVTDQYVYQYETEPETNNMIQYVGEYHKHSDNTLVIDMPSDPMEIGHRHEFNQNSIIMWSEVFVPELPPVPFEKIQDVKEAVSDVFYKLFFDNENISITDEDIRKSQTTIRDGKQQTGRQEDEQLVFYKKDRNTLENRKALHGYHFDAICEYLHYNYPELSYNDLLNNYHEYFELIIEEELNIEPNYGDEQQGQM